jgi:hypothetical protein
MPFTFFFIQDKQNHTIIIFSIGREGCLYIVKYLIDVIHMIWYVCTIDKYNRFLLSPTRIRFFIG